MTTSMMGASEEFGHSRAESRNDPQDLNGSKHETRSENGSEIEGAGLCRTSCIPPQPITA